MIMSASRMVRRSALGTLPAAACLLVRDICPSLSG